LNKDMENLRKKSNRNPGNKKIPYKQKAGFLKK
jgi:hypothetical protein